jgi:signal-transduction protein with cAMP-binding, CBS, and nucleotidyltransferase domain
VLKVERILPAAQERLVTIKTDALLVDAARLLAGTNLKLVVVCDDAGKMAGVITKTDVVGRISHCTGSSCTTAAANVMTRDVTFCHPSDWLHDVWSTIKQRGLQNIPVMDQGSRPVGVLNARDALQALLEDAQHEEQLLRDYVSCVGYR